MSYLTVTGHKMLVLELILIIAVMATLMCSHPFRQWMLQVTMSDLRIACIIVSMIVVFHLINVSGNSFPLVRWGMYSQIYEPEEIKWGKVQAQLEDGRVVWINPAQQFPSISRNFSERFRNVVVAADDEKLTPFGEIVYEQLLESIGHRYNRDHPHNQAVQVLSVLQTIRVNNGETVVENRTISKVAVP